MRQTFYIDVDEEISSVVDRLKKSMAVDNYFVAPKRAIFLQSIVNLKLLKREAEKMQKRVILVTQEEVVAAMAARSGVDVRNSIEEGTEEEMSDSELENEQDDFEIKEEQLSARKDDEKSSRLSSMGSNSFYDSQSMDVRRNSHSTRTGTVKNVQTVKTKNSSGEMADSGIVRNYRKDYNTVSSRNKANDVSAKNNDLSMVGKRLSPTGHNHAKTVSYHKLDSEKEKSLEQMFSKKEDDATTGNRQISNVKTKNFFFIFIVVCLLLLAGVAGYLYIPSADIIIKPNVQTVKVDADIAAGESKDTGNAIPVRLVERKEQLTLKYDATGKNSSSGKKAQGSVVVYNEFDKQPQTLVATTRLQSEDGKIFRLVRNITVPGVTNIGGEVKPGAISADIIADQPGSEYNIEAGKFTIPGFQGGSKYDKFYAKSSEVMSGGTTEGESSSGVSQGDLENAKRKTELAFKEKIPTLVAGELQGDEVGLPQAEKITMDRSFAGAKVGDAAQSFEYTVTADVEALVFSKKDIESVIEKMPQFLEQPKNVSKTIKKIEYVSVEPSFENRTMLLKIHGEIEITPKVDVEFFKNELLGKNESELQAVLKNNQGEIESVKVNFWPTFINRTPQFPQRVNVEVER